MPIVEAAFGSAFLTGLLRGPVRLPVLSVVAAVLAMLLIGPDWSFDVWKRFNDPILVDLLPKFTLVCAIAIAIGYSVGRLIAWGWHRLTRQT